MDTDQNLKDRCAGVIVGLAAGDRNGGPIRLAVRLLESLLEKKTFDENHVVGKYFNYFRGPPHDSEKAFDTGHTFYSVFKLFSEKKSIKEASTLVQAKYGSIGVGAAHRNAAISMAPFISQKNLPEVVLAETYITHANKISYEVSLFVNIVCKELIIGTSWDDSVKIATSSIKETEVNDAITTAATCHANTLETDGYAPNVLRASLYFLHNHKSFEDALNTAIAFAGPGNFCPVLVGCMGGARFGANVILLGDVNTGNEHSQNLLLKHCSQTLLNRAVCGAESMGNMWLRNIRDEL